MEIADLPGRYSLREQNNATSVDPAYYQRLDDLF